MSTEKEKILRKCCEDHLKIRHVGKETKDFSQHTTYELFIQVYESVKELIDEKQEARKDDDYGRFRAADEKLWLNEFAIMAFAVAEQMGWMKQQRPVPFEELKD